MRRTAESLQSELTKEDSAHITAFQPGADASNVASVEIGRTFRHLGIAITLIDVDCPLSVQLKNTRSRYEEYEDIPAGDGAKFVMS